MVPVPPPPPMQTPMPPSMTQPAPFTSASLNSVVLKKTTSSGPPRRTPTIESNTLQAELKQRVSSQNQRNFVLPRKNGKLECHHGVIDRNVTSLFAASSTSLVINQLSSPDEVYHWLCSLGFSDLTVASLGVLNGAQIFTLTKEELKQVGIT